MNLGFFIVALCLSTVPAFAHENAPLAQHDLLTAWSFDPLVVLGLVVSGYLYARHARARRGIRRWEKCAFWSGWTALLIALFSPLHALGEVLFSAHMAQHEIIMAVGAPLVVLGRAHIAFLWAFPGLGRSLDGLFSRQFLRSVVSPFGAWTIHAAALWIWHIPALFDRTIENEWIHALQHASFLFSALLFWWVLNETRGRLGASVFYVFTTALHAGALGALLTFASVAFYPAYAATAPNWGLTALQDQQLAGLIMWVPAGLAYVVVALYLFRNWLLGSEPERHLTAKHRTPESIAPRHYI